jgi:tetratricopeptide (TPR) repeat protein
LDREGESAARQTKAAAHGKSTSHTLKMAKFHTTRREFKEAIVLWTKLAEAKPDAFAEANLGWSYLQLGEKQKAQKHINRSIQLNPHTIEGYRYLGYFLMGEGKVPEAVKAFHTSMRFDPHHKCNCGDLEKLVISKRKNGKP